MVMAHDREGGTNQDGGRVAETISVAQLFRMFPDEDACHAWLEAARWRDGPVCPHCGGADNIVKDLRPRHYRHRDCRRRFTATTGTCMHATKKPLRDWLFAIYSVLTARKGVSAMQLSKELGCQHRTAWHMLHRIREACGRGDFAAAGAAEADGPRIAGREGDSAKAGRRAAGDASAVGGGERGEGESVRGKVRANGGDSALALFRRSVHGTWHHVSPKHLERYVNEAAFRLNEGNCGVDTLDRMAAFVQGASGRRLRYADLIKDSGKQAQAAP